MRQNEFEKQVQQMMDEIRFKPSGTVWPAVKSRVRKKDKRRFFFYMFLLATGLGLGGYFIMDKWIATDQPISQSSSAGKKQTETRQQLPIENVKPELADANEKVDMPNVQPQTKIGGQKAQEIGSKNKLTLNNDIYTPAIPAAKKPSIIQNDHLLSANDKEHQDNVQTIVTVDGIAADLVIKREVDAPIDKLHNQDNFLLTLAEQDLKERSSIGIENLETVAGIPAKKSLLKGWELGAHASIHHSRTGSNAFTPPASTAMDFNSAGPVFAVGRNPFTQTAILATPGLGWDIGIDLSKRLSQRSTIITGLQYFYATDKLAAGMRFDSTIRLQNPSYSNTLNNFYRGYGGEYTNQYHFIELPLSYQYKLIRGRVPLSVGAGLILSRLIATNALVYDTAYRGMYYYDKEQFRKTSFSLSSDIQVSFMQQHAFRFSAGPHFRVGVTDLRKTAFDKNKYLLSGGLRVRMIF